MPATPAPASATFENTTTLADTTEDSATTALFRAAIGPVNTAYYLDRFTRFDAADRTSASWNWGAALLTLNWMAYRQLWSAALIYGGLVVGLALLLLGIGRLVLQIPPDTEIGLTLALLLAAVALPGLYGNALLYTQSRKRMAHALASTHTLAEACALLNRQASSRQRLVWQALANAVLVGLAAATYLNLPKATPPAEPPIRPIASIDPLHPLPIQQSRDLALEQALRAASAASTPSAAASAPAPNASAPAQAASAPAPAPAEAASAPESTAPLNNRPEATDKIAKPATPAEPAPALAPAPAPVAQAKPPQATRKPVAALATKARAKPEATTATAATQSRYYVNIGLFADDNNARNVYVKLSDAGLPATQQAVKTPKGVLTRVRVGPFDNEHEAQRTADRVRALGLDALIAQ